MIKTYTGASEAKKKDQDREAVSKKGKRSLEISELSLEKNCIKQV